MNLEETALYYKSLGLSVVAVGINKKSIHYWEKYQQHIMNDATLHNLFGRTNPWGIAIVCGKVSGNLEVIDIDEKNALHQSMFNRYIEAISQIDPALIPILPIAVTKNEGYHFYYRCPVISNHMTLARRTSTEQELRLHPKHKIRILIEKLGEANYVIVPPSPLYRFIQHDMGAIPVIEPAQRKLLIDTASSFNQYIEPEISRQFSPPVHTGLDSPFNDYNARGDITSLLEKHGWIVVKATKQRTYFRRPGQTDHDTSADYHHELGLFVAFTSSTGFQRRVPYRPYAVYAILECNGDFKLAAKKLLAEGYGISYKERSQFF